MTPSASSLTSGAPGSDRPRPGDPVDRECMTRAIAAASEVRCITSPNPWVGAGASGPRTVDLRRGDPEPGGPHAEVSAVRRAGEAVAGRHAVRHARTVLPHRPDRSVRRCHHRGRDRSGSWSASRIPTPTSPARASPACVTAGVEVEVGVQAEQGRHPARPVPQAPPNRAAMGGAQVGATLDGGTAAPNGTSQWITSPPARADGHRLRAESDAILVGAGTVRRDDPSLTVRDYRPPVMPASGTVDPVRVVLGGAIAGREGPTVPAVVGRRRATARRAGGGRSDPTPRRGRRQRRWSTSTVPAWSTATSSTWRRRCSVATTPTACSAMPGAVRHLRDVAGRFVSVERIGDDLRVELARSSRTPSICRRARPTRPTRRRGVLMFTGIVEELGSVVSLDGPRLRLRRIGRHGRRRASVTRSRSTDAA